jgi:choloylglycine hydrolase
MDNQRIVKRRLAIGLVALAMALASLSSVRACSSFLIRSGEVLVAAKNLDWHLDDGFVMVNKRGVAKTAFLLDPGDKPAAWVSRFGSVTFNQYGREMPNGGMNEAGLVVETLMLTSTRYPSPDARPAVTAWMQYQLDNSRTVAEVIGSDQTIRIHYAMPMPTHFFVCDRTGQAAVIEFRDGRLVCHTAETMPVQAITNDTYEDSMRYLREHVGFGGERSIPQGRTGSLDRFVMVADRLKNFTGSETAPAVAYAFDTLDRVKQGDATQWRIVYDLTNRKVHFKTLRQPQIKTVALADLDFDCRTPARMIGLNTPRSGRLNAHLFDYDPDLNRWLLFYTVRKTDALKSLSDALIEQLAAYPETTVCQ